MLFDEIEKAAPSLVALLLGVLDGDPAAGRQHPGEFREEAHLPHEQSGRARDAERRAAAIGFQGAERRSPESIADRLQTVGFNAVRRRFSPEFVNRIDVVITYGPLDANALGAILDHHMAELQQHVRNRLGERSFDIEVTAAARQLLLDRGTSEEYGARELKRTIHRLLTQPLAALVAHGNVPPGGRVTVDLSADGDGLSLAAEEGPPPLQSSSAGA